MKRRAVSAWLHLSLGTTETALLALTKKNFDFFKVSLHSEILFSLVALPPVFKVCLEI